MKRAIGELNLTVVVLVAIAALLGFFMIFKDSMFSSVMAPTCCLMSKGSYSNGICSTTDQASYHECLGGSSISVGSGSNTSGNINDEFLNSSNSISGETVSNNTKDSGVQNSINGELSIQIGTESDKGKEDDTNKDLNTESKNNIKDIVSNTTGGNISSGSSSSSNSNGTTGGNNTSGSNSSSSSNGTIGGNNTSGSNSSSSSNGTTGGNISNSSNNNEYVTSGKITGTEKEIKEKTSKGLKTEGDYTKSKITNTTSSYSSDKSIYTTTSTVKSNTSNYQITVTHTYKKDKNGEYKLTEVLWKETTIGNNLINGYEKTTKVSNKEVKNSYNSTLKDQYSTEKLDKYIEENAESIYNELNGKVVFLNTYNGDSIVENGNGVFINPGIVVTTWNFVKRSVINGNKMVITNVDGGNYTMDGIISIDTELDLAFIKLKENIGTKTELGNVYDLKVEAIDFTLCTGDDYSLEVKYGYLLKRGGLITSLITLERNEEGSPLFDYNKKLIGINTANVLKSSTSIARSTNYIKNMQKKFDSYEFNSIKVTSFNDLKNKYINENSEVVDNTIPRKIWNKYKRIGDIENTITLNLIKSSYDDNIISLRYVNDISNYSDNFSLADNFISKLVDDGYKLKHSSTYKIIYQKGSKKVVLLSEFNYLIIIMMGE